MRAPLDFLWAIISDGWAIFSTLLSIASIAVIATHKTGNLPVWVLWMVGYIALFITAGRIWHKEYRQLGPQIDLEYMHVKGRDDQLIIYNNGPEDAFDVKIEDIYRGESGYVSFEPTKVRSREKAFVEPIVHGNPPGSILFRARLFDFILEAPESRNFEEFIAGVVVPVSILYQSIHGQRYKSTFNVVFFPLKHDVKVNFIRCHRIFKSFLTFPRLSKRGR